MSICIFRKSHLRVVLFVLILVAIALPVLAQQIDIDRIEEMPNLPSPYELRDWKAVASGYDSLVFDFSLEGEYLPLIWWNPSPVNYPDHASFGLETVVGTPRVNSGEAINILPAVIGASLVGIDKSDQNGYDWVLMCEEFFNRRPEENVYLNGPVSHSGNDWWYETMPNIFFYQLYDLYPGTGDFEYQFTTVADQFYRATEVMGGDMTPWDNAYMNYQSFSFSTMEPIPGGVNEPEAAGAFAWILYNAFVETGDEKYRIAAEWAMEYLEERNQNPCYEIQMPYGALAGARMNAELGTNYDIYKFVNWCFTLTSLRSWGVMAETWGGYDVHGLVGELSANDYAFMMNGYQHVGALVPLTRYDDRFSRAIGKWVLNVANASRLFYTNYLPDENQDSEDWSHQYDPNSYIGHEAIREEIDGMTPYATGDAISGGWGETNLVLYGSSHVGILGGIVDTTDVEGVLILDLLKTDYFRNDAYPTYLIYNPYDEITTVQIDVGNTAVDLYDAITNSFVLNNVNGQTDIDLPADAAIQLVYVPAGGTITYNLNKTLSDGVVIDYNNEVDVTNYPPRIKALAPEEAPVIRNQTVDIYCSAEDRDGNPLDYTWQSEAGVISGSGAMITWTAPDEMGDYSITVTVEDDGGLSDETTIEIEVVPSTPPVIESLIADPSIVSPGGETTITCTASDPEGEELIYNWSASTGTISGTGSEVVWTSPDNVGYYDVQCEVEDEYGLTDESEVGIVAGHWVAYLPFDGNTSDQSGFENHAILNGPIPTYDQSYLESRAYGFDGIDDNITIPMHPSLAFTEEITLNLWMRLEERSEAEMFVISHGSWQNRWKISIIPDGRLRWTVKNEPSIGGIVDLDSQSAIRAGRWYNVSVTYGSGSVKMYLNGELESERGWTGIMNLTEMDLTIGQMVPGNTEYNFFGSLDEIRIYNRVLTDEEISTIYEETSGVDSDGAELPMEYAISNIYPNPFNTSTRISYQLPESSTIELTVYNVNGQKVKTLIKGFRQAGYHNISWSTENLSSGLYFIRYTSGSNINVRKLMLVK